jgi:hypothetical protein
MTGVQIMVVDEADRMLDMGSSPDLERIFKLTPVKKQTLFFSATMPPEITRSPSSSSTTLSASRLRARDDGRDHHPVLWSGSRPPTRRPKRTALRMLIARDDVRNGIVFCNRKSEVDIVAKSLKTPRPRRRADPRRPGPATRMRTLESFRKGELKLLVRLRRGGPRPGHPGRQPRLQLRRAAPRRRLRPPHRPHRPRRQAGQTFMIVTPADSRNLDKVLKLIGKVPRNWCSTPTGRTSRTSRATLAAAVVAERRERSAGAEPRPRP